jgi:hypothetical protein
MLVDLVGFEPTTSSMPWKRAPNCATGPRSRDNRLFRRPVERIYSAPAFFRSQTAARPVLRKLTKISILALTEFHKMTRTYMSIIILLALLPAASMSSAQITPSNSGAAPVPYASVSQLNTMLAQLEQVSATTQTDLARVRVEKWKTDGSYKKQAQGNIDSIRRNLQSALPEMITQLRNSPADLGATFKLYRNLDALFGVMGGVTESAGAFGSKDEFQSLSNDMSAFERSRREFAERMETLASSKEAELTQLRTQLKALQAAAPAPPPKKIIVDDTEPKKPAKKKPSTNKVPKPPTASTPPTSTPPPPQ